MLVIEEVVALKKSVLEEVEATLALVPRDSVMLSVLQATLCLTPSIPPATILLLSRDWDSPYVRCVYCSGVNAASRTRLQEGTQECSVTLLV